MLLELTCTICRFYAVLIYNSIRSGMIYLLNYSLILAIKPQLWIKSQSHACNWWTSASHRFACVRRAPRRLAAHRLNYVRINLLKLYCVLLCCIPFAVSFSQLYWKCWPSYRPWKQLQFLRFFPELMSYRPAQYCFGHRSWYHTTMCFCDRCCQ